MCTTIIINPPKENPIQPAARPNFSLPQFPGNFTGGTSYKRNHIVYVALPVWLLSLSITFVSVTYVAAYNNT